MTDCCTTGPSPTLAGYLDFLRNVVGITEDQLPSNTPVIQMSYCIALEVVNRALQATARVYSLAVYNLATSNLLQFAPDPTDGPIVPGSDPPAKFFANLRNKWNLLDFISGVVQSAGDNGTSESMIIMDAAAQFTLMNLQQLKDPYGRQYLAFAQSYGTLWGLT